MQKTILPAILSIFVLASCSLKYDNRTSEEDSSPEIEAQEINYKRYEERKITVEVEAGAMEQYRDTRETFVQDTRFRTWDENLNLSSEGSCYLLGADIENGIYTLFGNISINNISQNFTLRAPALRWDNKNQKLTSGKDDTIFIERDDAEFQGKGFSADGITHDFSFESSVSGTITTQDSEESANE